MINILSIVSFFFHEFYVSVSYMEYDVEKRIEVQKKIFDDFEVALKKNKLNKFDILGSKELVDNYIEEYLNETFSLRSTENILLII